MSYDVLVVGSGYSGLGAAALLCKAGVRVAVAEQDRQVGGRAKVIERDGFVLDYGVHSYRYGEKGAAAEFLRRLGCEVEWIHERTTNYLIQGKELIAFPGGSKEDAKDAPRLLDKEGVERVRGIIRSFVSCSPDEWLDKSFADFLGDDVSDEKQGLLFRALGFGIMEPDPAKVSAGELILHLRKSFAAGIQSGEVKGGTGRILDGLVGVIEASEGKILLRTRVKDLRINRKRVWEAVTSKGNIHADAVIFAAPLQSLFSVIDKRHFKAEFIKRCENLVPTSGVALDYGLKRSVSDVKGWFIDPEDGVLGRFPSNMDPGLAPEGKQLSSWFMLLEHEDARDRRLVRSKIKQLRGIIRKVYPDFYEAKEFERILILPVVDGVVPCTGQTYRDRPDFSAPGIENLFLVGDTTAGEGVSGDIAWNSAREVVPRVLEFMGRG